MQPELNVKPVVRLLKTKLTVGRYKESHLSKVYCTTESVPAAVLSWPQVTAGKNAESSLKIHHSVCSEAGQQQRRDTDLLSSSNV